VLIIASSRIDHEVSIKSPACIDGVIESMFKVCLEDLEFPNVVTKCMSSMEDLVRFKVLKGGSYFKKGEHGGGTWAMGPPLHVSFKTKELSITKSILVNQIYLLFFKRYYI
jgi:hypothetical protein